MMNHITCWPRNTPAVCSVPWYIHYWLAHGARYAQRLGIIFNSNTVRGLVFSSAFGNWATYGLLHMSVLSCSTSEQQCSIIRVYWSVKQFMPVSDTTIQILRLGSPRAVRRFADVAAARVHLQLWWWWWWLWWLERTDLTVGISRTTGIVVVGSWPINKRLPSASNVANHRDVNTSL